MTNYTLQIKIKQRLNKLSSYDYDNIEQWMVVEAVNKAQNEFVRDNVYKGETDKKILDSLQQLLINKKLTISNQGKYYESTPLFSNYLAFGNVSLVASREGCSNTRDILTYLVENPAVDYYLKDPFTRPSWDWGETIVTLTNNKIRIYTDKEFEIERAVLNYYRFPQQIQIAGSQRLEDGATVTTDIPLEFKDDIAELIIDRACAILAYDIESFNQAQRNLENSLRP